MTYFEINKQDIIHNYEELSHITQALVIPTLKANAYGMGAKEVACLLRDHCGVNLFAVSRLEEAQDMPCGGGVRTLVLSAYHDDESIRKLVDSDLIMAVDSISQARRIAEYAKSTGKYARVHIKVDTGFGRFGFSPENIGDISAVYSVEGLSVRGIFSHFSSAFANDLAQTDKQFDTFATLCDELSRQGFDIGVRHIANSSAALRGAKYCLDAVRIGSALTGRVPFKTTADLKRVGHFYSEIADIRTLKKGSNVGYGNIYKLKKDTRVAVVCCGSADGVLIKKDYDTFRFIDIMRYGLHVFKMLFKDNRLAVKIGGKTVRAVGRPALTHTFLDVTDISCRAGDRVEFDISPLYVSDKVKREYIDV